MDKVIIDKCSELGYDIPRFCYHENLKVAGNRRMCSIEDSKAPKPVISCASNVALNLSIFTNTIRVKKARESVMEFLSINHPLDRPICDQGGERDLQDLALIYGADHGRFYDYKKNVEDKNCGPVVKTIMNRCILRTRCVRFSNDIAGYNSFGVTGRGGRMEIGSYIEKAITSDLSGNLIDIRPVGALTSKPYSFMARPWELKRHYFLTTWDEQPQMCRVDIKENEIVRITPTKGSVKLNKWITDRTRFSHEGLKRQRIFQPKILDLATTWEHTISYVLALLKRFILNSSIKIQPMLLNCDIDAPLSLLDITTVNHLAQNSICNISYINKGKKSAMLNTNNNILNRWDLTSLNLLNLETVGFFDIYLQYEAPVLSVDLTTSLLNENNKTLLITWRAKLPLSIENLGIHVSLESTNKILQLLLLSKHWLSSFINGTSFLFLTMNFPLYQVVDKFFKNNSILSCYIILLSNTAMRSVAAVGSSTKVNDTSTPSMLLSTVAVNQSLPEIGQNRATFMNSIFASFIHEIDSLTNFILPIKTLIEQPIMFYNNNYTIVKSPKVLTSGKNVKTLRSILVLVYSFLYPNVKNNVDTIIVDNTNITDLVNFSKKNKNYENNNSFESLIVSKPNLLLSFLHINKLYDKKAISVLQYYNINSLLANSTTNSVLAKQQIFINIY